MEGELVKNIIESILYVSSEKIRIEDLANLFEMGSSRIKELLVEMALEREEKSSGILIRFIEDGVQLCTNNKYAKYVEELLAPVKSYTLSQAAIETLAIIAYMQPVTKNEIESIRGIRCDYTVGALVDKGLVYVCGKKDTIGRPNLYSTSEEFLRHFGLKDLGELPKLNKEQQNNEQENFYLKENNME